mmetsp:Transcript_5027/g.9588  ORF Transcript_5027/g.9588 Transcript_5027/m.9588 type:complete len:253 (-) Transcript_5027:562-1320(-)
MPLGLGALVGALCVVVCTNSRSRSRSRSRCWGSPKGLEPCCDSLDGGLHEFLGELRQGPFKQSLALLDIRRRSRSTNGSRGAFGALDGSRGVPGSLQRLLVRMQRERGRRGDDNVVFRRRSQGFHLDEVDIKAAISVSNKLHPISFYEAFRTPAPSAGTARHHVIEIRCPRELDERIKRHGERGVDDLRCFRIRILADGRRQPLLETLSRQLDAKPTAARLRHIFGDAASVSWRPLGTGIPGGAFLLGIGRN